MISKFKNIHYFLSNFYPSPIIYKDHEYPTVEHAYQAAKTLDHEAAEEIRYSSSPVVAKKLGRKVVVRGDWDKVKVPIMRDLLARKFAVGSPLAALLLSTGDEELKEGNWWGDTFWGVCNGVGENWLGKLLMERRIFLKDNN